jgi:hypothetical protein
VFGAAAALAIGLGAGAGSAYAYFTSAGSGTSAASVGTTQQVTLVAATSGSALSTLIPGGTADLRVQLNNPNSFSVTIVGISQNGPVTVVGGTGCTSDSGTWPSLTLGNSGVSVPTQTGLSITVAAGPITNVVVHVANGASMNTSSASGCQGATFQIPVTITVQR